MSIRRWESSRRRRELSRWWELSRCLGLIAATCQPLVRKVSWLSALKPTRKHPVHSAGIPVLTASVVGLGGKAGWGGTEDGHGHAAAPVTK